MAIGDIVLVKGPQFVSKLIEGIEQSPYSHTAGIVRDGVIIEADGFKRTSYASLDKYHGYADIYTYRSLTDQQRTDIVKYVQKEVGSHYDWILLFVEGVRYVYHTVIPYKKRFRSHICSTLWADAYRSVGIDLTPHIPYPSPKDLSESKLLQKCGPI